MPRGQVVLDLAAAVTVAGFLLRHASAAASRRRRRQQRLRHCLEDLRFRLSNARALAAAQRRQHVKRGPIQLLLDLPATARECVLSKIEIQDVLSAAGADRASWAAFRRPAGAALLFSIRLGPHLAADGGRLWRRAVPHVRDVFGVVSGAPGSVPDLSAAPALRSVVLFGRSVAGLAAALPQGPEVSASMLALWASGPLGGDWEAEGFADEDASIAVPGCVLMPRLKSLSVVAATCREGDMESLLGLLQRRGRRRVDGGGASGGGSGSGGSGGGCDAEATVRPAGAGEALGPALPLADEDCCKQSARDQLEAPPAPHKAVPHAAAAPGSCQGCSGADAAGGFLINSPLNDLAIWTSDPLNYGFSGSPTAWAATLRSTCPKLQTLSLGVLHARLPDAFWSALGGCGAALSLYCAVDERPPAEAELREGTSAAAAAPSNGGTGRLSGGGGGGERGAAPHGPPPPSSALAAPTAPQHGSGAGARPRAPTSEDVVRRLNAAAPESAAIDWGLPAARPDLSGILAPRLRLALPGRGGAPLSLPGARCRELEIDFQPQEGSVALGVVGLGVGGDAATAKWTPQLLFPPLEEVLLFCGQPPGSYLTRRIAVANGPIAYTDAFTLIDSMLGDPSGHVLAWTQAGVDWCVSVYGGGAGLYAVAVQHMSDWLLQAPPGALLLALSPARGRAPFEDAVAEQSRRSGPLCKRRYHAAVLVGTPAAVRAEAAALKAAGREVCCMPREQLG